MVLLLLTLNALGTLFWYFHCWFPNASCNISHKLLRPRQFQDKFMGILEWSPTPLLTVSAHWKSSPVNLTVLEGMSNGFMTNYITAWEILFSKKNWSVKINEKYNGFFFLTEDVLSTQFVLFLHAMLKNTNKFLYFFYFMHY